MCLHQSAKCHSSSGPRASPISTCKPEAKHELLIFMQINSKLGIGAAQVSLPSQSHEELMDTLFALSHCNCVARCGKHAKHAPHAETQLKFPKVVPTTHQARHLSLASTMPQYETPGLSHRVGCHKLPCLHPGFGAAQVSLPGSNHERIH